MKKDFFFFKKALTIKTLTSKVFKIDITEFPGLKKSYEYYFYQISSLLSGHLGFL